MIQKECVIIKQSLCVTSISSLKMPICLKIRGHFLILTALPTGKMVLMVVWAGGLCSASKSYKTGKAIHFDFNLVYFHFVKNKERKKRRWILMHCFADRKLVSFNRNSPQTIGLSVIKDRTMNKVSSFKAVILRGKGTIVKTTESRQMQPA